MPNSYRRIILVLLLFDLLLASVPLSAQDGAEIDDLYFTGNEEFSDKELRKQIRIRRTSALSKLVFGDQDMVYQEERLADDMIHVARFYQREGYLWVQIDKPSIVHDKEKDQVDITVPIHEGDFVSVNSTGYIYYDLSPDEERRLRHLVQRRADRMALQQEERFRDSSVVIDQDSLIQQLANEGYPYAEVEHEISVDTTNKRVSVVWHVHPGPIAYFDTVAVSGNTTVSDELISKMAAFKKGQRYNQRLVERTQQQVYGLGMFQVATVHPLFGDSQQQRIPVEILVREGPQYRVKGGIGYGREDHFRVFTDLYRYGFFGETRRLRLYARHSGLEPYHVRLTFTQPAFIHPRTVLTISPFLRKQNEPAFSVRRLGGEIGVNHTFTPQMVYALDYTYERVRLLEGTPVLNRILQGSDIDFYIKSSVSLQGQFDNSYPFFTPIKGFYAAANVTVSGLGLGSTFKYWKSLADVRNYQKILGMVLASRIKVGVVDPLGRGPFVPLEERLFAGGALSVRGWGRQELGPKISGTPVGGFSLAEASVELRYPVYGWLSGAVFVDAGNVWLESFTYRLNELRYAVGVGARVSTPIGPIRGDVARPIFDEEKAIQFHIHVGQAF